MIEPSTIRGLLLEIVKGSSLHLLKINTYPPVIQPFEFNRII